MRATSLPAITAPALVLVAVLATTACTNNQEQQPTAVPPPIGAYSLGPNTSSGQTYSPVAGSISNGASGSWVLLQEGGYGVPR